MAKQHHSAQIDRDDEKFTQHARTYRLIARYQGIDVSTYATPKEVVHTMLMHASEIKVDITFPKAPRSNGRYEGDKGHRYNGPSKRTIRRRASRAPHSA